LPLTRCAHFSFRLAVVRLIVIFLLEAITEPVSGRAGRWAGTPRARSSGRVNAPPA